NNRLELTAPAEGPSVVDSRILAAGGGSLACYGGPTPTKALNHPAVTDFALARYLPAVASRGEAARAEPRDPQPGRKIGPAARDPLGGESDEKDDDLAGRIRNPRALQMVNRVFVVRQGTPGAVSLLAAGAWKVTPASQTRRRNEGLASVRRDSIPLQILRQQG